MNIPTVTLYGERGTAIVNEADAQAWLDSGWSREPLPAPLTALAVITNSPSESMAGIESEVPVPGPSIGPSMGMYSSMSVG